MIDSLSLWGQGITPWLFVKLTKSPTLFPSHMMKSLQKYTHFLISQRKSAFFILTFSSQNVYFFLK